MPQVTEYKGFEAVPVSTLFQEYVIAFGSQPYVPEGFIFCTHLDFGHPSKTTLLYVKPHPDLIEGFMEWRGGKEHDITAMIPNASNNFCINYMDGIGCHVVGHVPVDIWKKFCQVAITKELSVITEVSDAGN